MSADNVADCPLDPVLLLDVANQICTQKVVENLAVRLLQGYGGVGFVQRNLTVGGLVDWNVLAHRVLTQWCRCKPNEVSGERLYTVLRESGAVEVALAFQCHLGVQKTSSGPSEAAVSHPERTAATPAPVTGVLIRQITGQQRARLFYMIADDFALKRKEIIAHLLGSRANDELALVRSTTALPPNDHDLLYEGLEMWYKRTVEPCGRELYDCMIYAKCEKGKRYVFDYKEILKLPQDYQGGGDLRL